MLGPVVLGVRALLALVLCTFVSAASADDKQGWSALALTGTPVADVRLLIWFDAHARFQDDAEKLGVSIVRPGVGWRASDKLDLWLGYARIRVDGPGADIEEDRIWQQATYPVRSLWGGKLSGRTRLEQRSRDADDDTGWRLRQFLRWAKPIEGTALSTVVANETFVGLSDADWGQRKGYDQNRLFLGLAWQTAPHVRLEGGYLNNHIKRRGAGDLLNHNASVALVVQF